MASTYTETAHDYRVMYEGSLARLKEVKNNKTAPIVQILGFNSDGDPSTSLVTSVRVKTFIREEVELGVRTKEGNATVALADLDLSLPPFGFVNTSKSVYRVFHRKPSGNNKYRKLPVLQDISIDHPLTKVLDRLKLNPVDDPVNFFVLNFWNTSEYSQPQEAIQGLFNGDYLGRAISAKFCLFITDKSPKVFLGYDRYIAGSIDSPDAPIVLEDWAVRFREELEAFGLVIA